MIYITSLTAGQPCIFAINAGTSGPGPSRYAVRKGTAASRHIRTDRDRLVVAARYFGLAIIRNEIPVAVVVRQLAIVRDAVPVAVKTLIAGETLAQHRKTIGPSTGRPRTVA